MKLYQTKKLLHSKGKRQQKEKATTEWEKIFANHISEKGLILKICKVNILITKTKPN